MLVVIENGRPVVIVVCSVCRHSVVILCSQRSATCAHCGARATAPAADDETVPGPQGGGAQA